MSTRALIGWLWYGDRRSYDVVPSLRRIDWSTGLSLRAAHQHLAGTSGDDTTPSTGAQSEPAGAYPASPPHRRAPSSPTPACTRLGATKLGQACPDGSPHREDRSSAGATTGRDVETRRTLLVEGAGHSPMCRTGYPSSARCPSSRALDRFEFGEIVAIEVVVLDHGCSSTQVMEIMEIATQILDLS